MPSDVLITPASSKIDFTDGSNATKRLNISGTAFSFNSNLNVLSSTSLSSAFKAEGINGTLFEITDDLSNSLMSVNTIGGLPVFEVFANNSIIAGQYNANDFVILGNKIGLGYASPVNKLSVSGAVSIGSSYNVAAPSNGLIVQGNVGIGTVSPTNGTLQVYNASGNTLSLQKSGGFAALAMGSEATVYTLIESINTGGIRFYTGNGTQTERWKITSAGILESTGAQTIRTSIDSLTLATNAGNGHVLLSPHGTGNVGIGNATPKQLLHINGNILLDGLDNGYTQPATRGIGYGSNSGAVSGNGFSGMDIQSVNAPAPNNGNYSQNLRFWTHHYGLGTGGTPRMFIQYDGNIGIGTVTPAYKLDVNGSTRLGGIIYNESVQTDDFNYFNLQPYVESETLSSILTFGGAAPTFVTLTNTAAPFSKVLSVSAYGEAYLGDYIPVQAGETIYGEIWTFRATGAAGTAGTFYCGVMRYDKDKKMIDSNQGLNTAPSGYFIASNQTIPLNSTWTKYSGTLVLPTSHPSYATSDGGPVRYIRPYIIYNYTAGTILTYIGGWKIRKVQLTRDSGPVAINGSVAIGSNSVNYGRLQISATTTSPSLSATNPTDPSLIISNSDVAYGTMFATYGDGKGALQQRRTDAATYYDFSLQPHGGNVGIGTNSPASKLQINNASDSRLIVYETGASPYTATLELSSQTYGTYGATVQYTSNAETLTIENYGRSATNSIQGSILFKTKINNTTATNVAIINGFTGNVGIATLSPSEKLEVVGVIKGTSFSGAGTGLTGTASSLTAGTVTTNANLTGPITSVGNTTTITNSAVTYAKIQNVNLNTVLGRITTTAGVVEELTGANIATIIGANAVTNAVTAGTANALNTANSYQAVSLNLTGALQFGGNINWNHAVTTELGRKTIGFNIWQGGKKLNADEDFSYGNNNITVYNNAGGTALTITRTASATAPNSSGQVLRVSYNPGSNGTNPGFGGFFFGTSTAANKVFVTRFVANIPVGRQVDFHSNATGTNTNSYWLTNNVGTGKWEEYVFVVMCGNTGTFSSTNFFAISGGSNVGFTWDIASATVFDVTNKRDLVSSNFESYQSSNALTFNYLATNLNGNNPVPIYAFDVTSGAETRSIKAGIGYERHLTNGRGTLHIYNRSSDDITNITGLRSSAGDIKVSIDNAGNVGVGITIPNSKLHVFNSAGSSTIAANAIAVFEQSSNAGIQVCVPDANEAGLFFSRSGAAYYSAITRSGTDLLLKNNSATAVTINSTGSVGVGITAPTAKLDVEGSNTNGYSLLLRSGDNYNGTDSVQIAFGFANQTNYRHSIRTRHNPLAPISGVVGNNIDFYVWKRGTDAAADLGSQFVMTMQGDGNVGIGTTNPLSPLEIYKIPATSTTLQTMLTINTDFASASGTGFGGSIVFRGRTAGNLLRDNAQITAYNEDIGDNGYALGFYTRPSDGGGLQQRLTILRGGNVGIGTVTPAYKLDVNSSIVSRSTLSSPRFSNAGTYVYGVTNSPTWVIGTGSSTNNNVTAPDGTSSAGTYTLSATSASQFDLYQTISGLINGRVYTVGMWVKLGTATNFCLVVNNTATWNTIGGKAFTSSDGLSSGKWTHISYTFAATASAAINLHLGYHLETGVTQQTAGTVFLWNIEMTEFSSTWIGNVEDEIRLPGSSIWTSRGNVGIGTLIPTAKLDTLGVRLGRDFSLANRATVRLDSNGVAFPSDVLFGHTVAANQDGWNGVYWSLSSRAAANSNRFYFYRGSGNPAPNNSEAVIMSFDPTLNVGVGFEAPTNRLSIAGSVSIGSGYNTAAPANGLIVEGSVGIGVSTLNAGAKLHVVGNADIGDSAADTGIIVRHGAGSAQYGRIRFYSASTNIHTIHSFPTAWNSGTFLNASAGAINLQGTNGVTFGSWNSIDVAFAQGGNNYFKGNVGIGITIPSATLHLNSTTSGATLLRADGTNGTLFSVIDDLSDSLMSVNNSAGLPVLEVFADDRVVAGQYGANDFVLRNNKLGLGTSNPIYRLNVYDISSGSVDEVFVGTIGNDQIVGGRTSGSFGISTKSTSNGNLILTANSEMYLRTGGSNDRVFIKSDGNVGIGTVSAAYKLQVNGNGYFNSTLQVNSNITLSGGGDVIINDSDGTGTFNSFMDSGVGYIRIDDGGSANGTLNINSGTLFVGASSGSVGIGTTSPIGKLTVQGNIEVNYNSIVANSSVRRSFLTAHATINRGANISFGLLDGASSPAGMTVYNTAAAVGAFNSQFIGFNTHEGGISEGERMRITSIGYIGIGTTNPAALLQIGTGTPTAVTGGIQFGDDTGARIYRTNSSTIQVSNNLTVGGTITGALTGNVTGNVSGTAGGETFATVTGRGASTSTQIGVGTSSSGSMYTGIKSGAGYSDAVSGATFKSITDHPTGGSFAFAAYYNGAPGTGTNSFYVGADGSGYFRSTLTTSVIKADAGANYPHSFTNTDAGNTHWVNRSDRLLTSNGTNWRADGADPIMALVTSGNSNVTTIANSIGLALHNESQTNNTFSPAITFSNRSNSGSYNTTYAAIIGRKTGQGPDSNWSAGELHFYTMPVGAYVNNIPSLIINSAGNVGVGITAPTAKLNVLSTSSLSSVLKTEGVNGTLFEVTDDLSNSLMSVNTIGGLPVFEVFANNSIIAGQYGQNDFVISGNKVGIGTASPLTKLHIYENVSRVTYIAQNSLHTARFEAFGTATAIDTTASNGIFFRINSSSIVKFAADGNVGIGTVTPANKLHVLTTGGVVNAPNVVATFQANTNTTIIAGGGTAIKFVGVSSGGNLQDYDQCMISSLGYADNNRHGMQFWVKPNASTALTAALTINADSSVVANSSVTATSFSGPLTGSVTGTATNATQLGGVAASSYVRNDVDGTDSTALFRLKTVTKSLTVTAAWTDTGISGGSDLESGAYILTLNVDNYAAPASGGQYNETYTGIMYWYAGATNSADYDEIPLHKSGHAPNGRYINLRTLRGVSGVLKLQITCNLATGGASNYIFKFRRMI